jgi:hypothetical protein
MVIGKDVTVLIDDKPGSEALFTPRPLLGHLLPIELAEKILEKIVKGRLHTWSLLLWALLLAKFDYLGGAYVDNGRHEFFC